MSKDFKTITQLLEYLKNNKNATTNGATAFHILKYGYYDNVNCYKFLYHEGKNNNDHIYKR